MSAITKILCPVDLSDTSRRALDYAIALARMSGARVRVIEVVDVALPPMPVSSRRLHGLTKESRAALTSELKRFVETAETTGVAVEVHLKEGAPVAEILDEAKTSGADVIVMGTHGRSGFDRLVFGSVTEKVLRKADCAVLAVPPAHPGEPIKPPSFNTILCATDFSEASSHAIQYALSIANQSKGRVVLMHAVDWPFGDPEMEGLPPAILELRRSLRVDAQERLHWSVSADMRKSCPLDVMVTLGKPAGEIIELAKQRSADLIVMGASGRHAINLALLGSTTCRVLRDSPCPVLSVPHPRQLRALALRPVPAAARAGDERRGTPDSPIGIASR